MFGLGQQCRTQCFRGHGSILDLNSFARVERKERKERKGKKRQSFTDDKVTVRIHPSFRATTLARIAVYCIIPLVLPDFVNMVPPIETFPVHELENSIRSTTKDLKPRSRKLPKDFSLVRDCPLYEMVQWSCTTMAEIEERRMRMAKEVAESHLSSLEAEQRHGHAIDVVPGTGDARIVRNDAPGSVRGSAGGGTECYPFVRLFRRCVDGRGETFHVETTAWEGRKKWRESERQKRTRMDKEEQQRKAVAAENGEANSFAQYGSYFWSGK